MFTNHGTEYFFFLFGEVEARIRCINFLHYPLSFVFRDILWVTDMAFGWGPGLGLGITCSCLGNEDIFLYASSSEHGQPARLHWRHCFWHNAAPVTETQAGHTPPTHHTFLLQYWRADPKNMRSRQERHGSARVTSCKPFIVFYQDMYVNPMA